MNVKSCTVRSWRKGVEGPATGHGAPLPAKEAGNGAFWPNVEGPEGRTSPAWVLREAAESSEYMQLRRDQKPPGCGGNYGSPRGITLGGDEEASVGETRPDIKGGIETG
ncbi:unnamed protein product [Haemonchus placei]|uniref:Uncharacterized protein n=1 Tax=Haemonchus placei TaxID=6290 RepID=A0A0N4WYY3_HAEPC|nr:unnamed protein product [Haemonchus placei]